MAFHPASAPAEFSRFVKACKFPNDDATALLIANLKLNLNVSSCEDAYSVVRRDGKVILDMEQFDDFTVLKDLPMVRLFIRGKLSPKAARSTKKLRVKDTFTLDLADLDLRSIKTYLPVRGVTNLFLQGNVLKDYHLLARFPQLDTLVVESEILRIPSTLPSLKKLRHLTLYNGQYRSLTFVQNLPKLESLSLFFVETLASKSLKEFASANDLKALILQSLTSQPLDLRYLKSPYLSEVKLENFVPKGLAPLKNMPNLRVLALNKAGISDPTRLPKLKYLRVLDLSSNGITKMIKVSNYPTLDTLDLTWNRIRYVNFSQLPSGLKNFYLSANPVCDRMKNIDKINRHCLGHQTGQQGLKVAMPQTTAKVRKKPREDLYRGEMAKVIQSRSSQIQSCFNSFRDQDPSAQGRIVVGFAIGTAGGVSRLKILKSTVSNSKPLEQCILGQASLWLFPKPRDGKPIKIRYPFFFTSDPDEEKIQKSVLQGK